MEQIGLMRGVALSIALLTAPQLHNCVHVDQTLRREAQRDSNSTHPVLDTLADSRHDRRLGQRLVRVGG